MSLTLLEPTVPLIILFRDCVTFYPCLIVVIWKYHSKEQCIEINNFNINLFLYIDTCEMCRNFEVHAISVESLRKNSSVLSFKCCKTCPVARQLSKLRILWWSVENRISITQVRLTNLLAVHDLFSSIFSVTAHPGDTSSNRNLNWHHSGVTVNQLQVLLIFCHIPLWYSGWTEIL